MSWPMAFLYSICTVVGLVLLARLFFPFLDWCEKHPAVAAAIFLLLAVSGIAWVWHA